MRDALNRTFTQKVPIDGEEKMLSDVLGLEGKGQEAFDEIMTSMPEILLRQICGKQSVIGGSWEVSGRDCFDCVEGKDSCIWSLFVNAVGKRQFRERGRYERVIGWLMVMHRFSDHEELQGSLTDLFAKVLTEEVLPLCQEHNKKIEREDTV